MISVKRNGPVFAACDENLLGKRFEDKELVLDIRESFYKGELVEEQEFIEMLAEAENANLVGENTINIAKKQKLINTVGRIKDIPYAMMFKV